MSNRRLKYQWEAFIEYMKFPGAAYLALLPFAVIIAVRGLFVVPIIMTLAILVISVIGIIHAGFAAQSKISEENIKLMQGIHDKQ
jgi:NADH:ubiquinone oxidoreductase subunit H